MQTFRDQRSVRVGGTPCKGVDQRGRASVHALAGRATRVVRRRGFTLVELLIVISILLILTTIVVVLFNTSFNSERIRGAARQTQSIMLGAQSRAAVKREPRGVRLLLDQNNPTVVNAFAYIGPPAEWREGTIQLRRPDTDGSDDDGDGLPDGDGQAEGTAAAPSAPNEIWSNGGGWKRLYEQKLLVDGARIRIPSNGSWYTVSVNPAYLTEKREVLFLNGDYRVPPVYPWPAVQAYPPTDYLLELRSGILGDEQTVLLPGGIVIDLYHSRIPASWHSNDSDYTQAAQPGNHPGPDRQVGTADDLVFRQVAGSGANTVWRVYFPQNLDILFSPRGMVQGPLAAQGIVHLMLADTFDTDLRRHPVNAERDNLIVTLFTRTGAVSTHPIYYELGPNGVPGSVGDDDGNGTIDDASEIGWASSDDVTNDLFRYAETGQVAGK